LLEEFTKRGTVGRSGITKTLKMSRKQNLEKRTFFSTKKKLQNTLNQTM
jgi:hypothetical protein